MFFAGRDEADGNAHGSRRLAIREFLLALASPHTFNPRRNVYAVFGFLWGLPVPVFSIGIDLMATGQPLAWASCCEAVARHPIHWLFILHPFLFAAIFGAMGTVRFRKDQQIARLVDDLESKVRALAEANDRLKDLDRMKQEFFANVSHDLKTPLVCLSGYTDMLAQGRLGDVTGEQRDALAVMARNAERLLRLIDELLEFGRQEEGRDRVVQAPFDLADVARAAADSLEPVLRQKGLRILLDGAGRPVPVLGDRDRILRVMVNLLSNACKFTPKERAVGIRLAAGQEKVGIEVWDEGIGLSEEDQRHLFERFWQADASAARPAGGTGLGMAIVKEILERHGSRVRVASAPGRGTRIRFELRPARGETPGTGGRRNGNSSSGVLTGEAGTGTRQ